MIVKPFEELEAFAHEEYVRKYASAPKPRVVNIEAVLTLTQPREFQWGGVGYRAPPLSFPLGFRCLVSAHALKDAREAGQPSVVVATLARRLLAQVAFPVARWRRILQGSALPGGSAEELEGLLWWMIHVPDETPSIPSTAQITIDWSDQLGQFAHAFPALIGNDGLPRTWALYVTGMRHLSRAHHREDLRRAWSTRAAGADKKSFGEWNAEWKQAAGW